jgi:hypothetical protein
MSEIKRIEKIISYAIGASGSVKPEILAKAVLQELGSQGYMLFKPEVHPDA